MNGNGEINMDWKNTIKKDSAGFKVTADNVKEEVEEALRQLKTTIDDALANKPEDVTNEEGQFIRSEVKNALHDFDSFAEHMLMLKEDMAEYAKTLGLWDGSYGYDYLPSGNFDEEGAIVNEQQ